MLWQVLQWAILGGAVLPLLYYLYALYSAAKFFGRTLSPPADFTPPISILKPVHGLDPGAYENFASFCRQDYPDYEILFCVTGAADPAIPVIEKLARDFPERNARLFMDAPQAGASNKVNKLCRLAQEARHEILFISDSDIRVAPDYLRQVVAPFASASVGGVTCMYLGIAERQLRAEIEAAASSDFFAGVLVARQLEGVRFMLGATMATTKARLAGIGGFEALADCFVDDYELGKRIARSGWRIELVRSPVWTHYPAMSLGGFFAHRLRWALAVKHARPDGYLGLLLTMGLPWSLAAAFVAMNTWLVGGGWVASLYLGAYVTLRLAVAWTVGVQGLNDPLLREKPWLVFLSDAVWFPVWLASLFTNRICWRGSEFLVRHGRLIPIITDRGPST